MSELPLETVTNLIRTMWESMQDRLLFLPPFPDQIDSTALFGLLLIVGLIIGERLHALLHWPKVIGYVVAGSAFGPSLLGWITPETLAQARPIADMALGLLMMEIGRRLDLRWLLHNRSLLRAALGEIAISFAAIFSFATLVAGLSPAWGAATAAVTMASAPAVVLLTVEETGAQGQVTDHIVLHTALGSAAAFILFTFVLGIVHAENSREWLNVLVHPLWISIGALVIAGLVATLALSVSRLVPKRSLAQVFVLIALALLAIGVARMLAVPIFLTLFLTGVALALRDRSHTLSYTNLPEGHWLLAIVLFVIVGASLPWHEFTWVTAFQAIALLVVRALAKLLAISVLGSHLPASKRLMIGIGIQPLSATAVFMIYELAALYPEIGRPALQLALLSAALMDLIGPALCQFSLTHARETQHAPTRRGEIG